MKFFTEICNFDVIIVTPADDSRLLVEPSSPAASVCTFQATPDKTQDRAFCRSSRSAGACAACRSRLRLLLRRGKPGSRLMGSRFTVNNHRALFDSTFDLASQMLCQDTCSIFCCLYFSIENLVHWDRRRSRIA